MDANKFTHRGVVYEVKPWREGIAVINAADKNDVRYIYGLYLDDDGRVTGLNGDAYDEERLGLLLTKMFDAGTTEWAPFAWQDKTVDFHGVECDVAYECEVPGSSAKHYRLIANGYSEGLEKDKSFTECRMYGAIATPLVCEKCGEATWVDDRNVPDGAMYEIECKNCGTMMTRRKI